MHTGDKVKTVKKMLRIVEQDLLSLKWHEDLDLPIEDVEEIVDDLMHDRIKIRCMVSWNTLAK